MLFMEETVLFRIWTFLIEPIGTSGFNHVDKEEWAEVLEHCSLTETYIKKFSKRPSSSGDERLTLRQMLDLLQ